MKSMLKSIGKILLFVFLIFYFGVAVFATACLMNFNEHRITQFGSTTLLILDENIGTQYKKGDLVVTNSKDSKEVVIGDSIFFYNPAENYLVNYAEVNNITEVNSYYNYTVGNNYTVYSEYYIGKDAKAYRHVGSALKFLESKYGFLIFIILPTLIAIVYEIYIIILEIIDIKKEED